MGSCFAISLPDCRSSAQTVANPPCSLVPLVLPIISRSQAKPPPKYLTNTHLFGKRIFAKLVNVPHVPLCYLIHYDRAHDAHGAHVFSGLKECLFLLHYKPTNASSRDNVIPTQSATVTIGPGRNIRPEHTPIHIFGLFGSQNS